MKLTRQNRWHWPTTSSGRAAN